MIKCSECGTELDFRQACGSFDKECETKKCVDCERPTRPSKDCPLFCEQCKDERCPDCGNALTVNKGDATAEYCGNDCECGWQHCEWCV